MAIDNSRSPKRAPSHIQQMVWGEHRRMFMFCWEFSRKPTHWDFHCQQRIPEQPWRGRDLEGGVWDCGTSKHSSFVHCCDSGHTFGSVYLPRCSDLRRQAPWDLQPLSLWRWLGRAWDLSVMDPLYSVKPRKCYWIFVFFSVTFSQPKVVRPLSLRFFLKTLEMYFKGEEKP